MKCPFCGQENIAGTDECESCGEDLTAFDGVRPHDLLEKGLVKEQLLNVAKCKTWLVAESTPIFEVAQKMDQDNNCCLIARNKELVGVVTVRDILQKAILRGFDLKKTPISQIMTPNPDVLTPEDKVVHALNKMAMGGYRHVPIRLAEGKYQVISVRDILAYLADKLPEVTGVRK